MQEPGTLIEGKYEILARIREGGMGSIYKVRHRLLDEIRVIKVMRRHVVLDEDLKRRFLEEAKTATRLKHPNIGTIHDFALDEDGTAYLVMEFIEGVTLEDLLESHGPPSLSLTLEVVHQTLLALGYLHRKNVIHRDIAPDNLMLTQDEEGQPRIKLIDLGIAKALDKDVKKTTTGMFLGKLKYASPEQFGSLPRGETLDGRSDIYSLGVVFYELLTGSHPLVGETPTELMKAHVFALPIPFSESDPDAKIPPELRAVVLKALEKKREDRYSSAEEFNREIAALQQRFARSTDLDRTAAILSTVRAAQNRSSVPVTPSAQDRLDRQFAAQTTPSKPRLMAAPRPASEAETAALPTEGPSGPSVPHERASHAPSSRRGRPVWIAGGLLVAALAAVLFLRQRAPGTPTPATKFAPTRRAPNQMEKTLKPSAAAEPTAGLQAIVTTVKPAIAEPAVASDQDQEQRRLSREAETARLRTEKARVAAEQARAPELARPVYELGLRKEKQGRDHLASRDYGAARTAFEDGQRFFQRAEIASLTRSSSESRPGPPQQIPPLAERMARAEPTRVVAAPTAPIEPVRAPTAVSTEPVHQAISEKEKILETLRFYERAASTLDVDLYARVYPAIAGERRRRIEKAWGDLQRQQLDLEIRSIEPNDDSHATARTYQRTVAVPRVGSEQRDAREAIFQLEKRGNSWVITRVQ